MSIRQIASAVALVALVAATSTPAAAQSQPADPKTNTVLDEFGKPALDEFGRPARRDPDLINK